MLFAPCSKLLLFYVWKYKHLNTFHQAGQDVLCQQPVQQPSPLTTLSAP